MESRLIFFSLDAPHYEGRVPDPIEYRKALNDPKAEAVAKNQKHAESAKKEADEREREGNPDLFLQLGLMQMEQSGQQQGQSALREDAAQGQQAAPRETDALVSEVRRLTGASDAERTEIIRRLVDAGPVALRSLLLAIAETGTDTPAADQFRQAIRRVITQYNEANRHADIAGDLAERMLRQGELTGANVRELGSDATYRLRQIITGERWQFRSRTLQNDVAQEQQIELRTRADRLLRPLIAGGDEDVGPFADMSGRSLANHERLASLAAENIVGIRTLSFGLHWSDPGESRIIMTAILQSLRANHERLFHRSSRGGLQGSNRMTVRVATKDLIENLQKALDSNDATTRAQAAEALQIILRTPDIAFDADADNVHRHRSREEDGRERDHIYLAARRYCLFSTAADGFRFCLRFINSERFGSMTVNERLGLINAMGPHVLGFFSPDNRDLRTQWITTLQSLHDDSNEQVRRAATSNLGVIQQLEKLLSTPR